MVQISVMTVSAFRRADSLGLGWFDTYNTYKTHNSGQYNTVFFGVCGGRIKQYL